MNKVIFQFWHNKNMVPSVIEENFCSNQRVHSDYDLVVADDEFMCDFISDHYDENLLNLYTKNQVAASRCDMARVLLLLIYGGMYLDASFRCHKRLDDHLEQRLPGFKTVLARRDHRLKNQICNGFICVHQPNNPLMLTIMESMIANLESKKYNDDVWEATGAGIYNRVYSESQLSEKIGFINLDQDLLRNCMYRMSSPVNENTWVQEQGAGIYRE